MQNLETLTSTIDATWFGAGLSAATQSRLAGLAREYEAPAQARLLREGEETREFSLLIHGRVAISELLPGRGPVVLLTVEPGDIFGWSALVPPFQATSTVIALEPVRVLAFDGARLRAAVRADVQLAAGLYEQVLEAVARRLLATLRELLELHRANAIGS
jgi:CRP/FNR family cyclic AMP-dependent transcriptional regulator